MIDLETQQFAKEFAKEFNIVCFFNQNDSWADCDKGWIGLEINVPHNEFLSLMCHEIQHVLCYRTNKWHNYHHNKASNSYMRRMGLKIERWVDKKANEMFCEFFPDLEFVPAYETEEAVRYYRKWLDVNYPEEDEK